MIVNTIYNEDCLKTMADMPDSYVDLIITSPPYEDIAGAGYQSNKKDILFLKLYSDFINDLFTQFSRVLRDGGQLFFNLKSKTFNKILKTPHWIEFTDGFQLLDLKSYIIWKYAGSFDSTNRRLHLDYEIIYHLSKGDNIYLNQVSDEADPLTSVWYIPHSIKQSERIHPTQMPLAVAEKIIKLASCIDDTVYDPFIGSGTTAVACIKNNRRWIGSEISEEYCRMAEKRILPARREFMATM